jgi:Uma2 family endonuclease
MSLAVLTQTDERSSDLLRPEPLPDGSHPEERVVVCGVGWSRYLDFDKSLGDDRPSPRLYFLAGELEIMTTSNEHERIKKWISGLLEIYFDQNAIETAPRGQATMRLKAQEAGAEPDESWCIGEEKNYPDLVLEIALTSGGVNKLALYRKFQIPEVWIWRRQKLEVFTLLASGEYEPVRESRLLPGLDIALVEKCATVHSWGEAKKLFRSGLGTS